MARFPRYLRVACVGLLLAGLSRPALAVTQPERDALIAIYNATNGALWDRQTGWLGAAGTECEWVGVICVDGRVRELNLASNKLTGSIPPEIGNLTELHVLDLSLNSLTGPIPVDIGQLKALRNLTLAFNQLSGSIPAALGTLPELTRIYLTGNALTGSIPEEIGQLTKLSELSLGNNRLSGTLPRSLGGLTELTILNLGNQANLNFFWPGENQFQGPFPAELSNLRRLNDLSLAGPIGEPFPAFINDLTALSNLQLSGFGGAIPSDIGRLTNLRSLELVDGSFTSVPATIGQLDSLFSFTISNQNIESLPPQIGEMAMLGLLTLADTPLKSLPVELRNLGTLQYLAVQNTDVPAIPVFLGQMTQLSSLFMKGEKLQGTIPAELGNLQQLQVLSITESGVSGSIPPELGRLQNLRNLFLSQNQLTGPLPPQIGDMRSLTVLYAWGNRLTGPLPAQLAQLADLRQIVLMLNEIDGTIPPELGRMTLSTLQLNGNRLSGSIPAELGQITPSFGFVLIDLSGNQLTGTIPPQLLGLGPSALVYVAHNALTSNDGALRSFLNKWDLYGDFEKSQTVPPTRVQAVAGGPDSIVVSWDPIKFRDGPGGYEIEVSPAAGGPVVQVLTTPNRAVSAARVSGLQPLTRYSVRVRTLSYPQYIHYFLQQKNLLVSPFTPAVEEMTTSGEISPARVVVISHPTGLLDTPCYAQLDDQYILANLGGTATDVTLEQQGTFFTQSPATFRLQPNESQVISLRGNHLGPGTYTGASLPRGNGVPADLSVPVRLLTSSEVVSTVTVTALTPRVDVSGAPEENPTGVAVFRNDGPVALAGAVISDNPWITLEVPPSILLRSGETFSVPFRIRRSARPDAGSLNGSVTGSIRFIYMACFEIAKLTAMDLSTLPGAKAVIVDTVKPPVTGSAIPALQPGEVALFVPAVGHIAGSVGLFVTDLAIANAYGASPTTDLKMFYTAASGSESLSATLTPLSSRQGVRFGDITKSVFSNEQQFGTIQLRTRDVESLAVSAAIANISNPAGTYGAALPVFRSDRSARPGEILFLSGVLKSPEIHTNLFLQETAGLATTYRIDFLDQAGRLLRSTSGQLGAFGLFTIIDSAAGDVVPLGTAAARIENLGSGMIAGFATPVDEESGDFWAVVDWNRFLGQQPSGPAAIVVAGTTRGANQSFFRTDATITNIESRAGSVRMRFHSTAGPRDATIELAPLETRILPDIIGSTFGFASAVGYLAVEPLAQDCTAGVPDCAIKIAVCSRTYATVEGLPGTYGTAVPTVSVFAGLRRGQSKLLSAIEDIVPTRVAGPGTFRTNIGLLETAGSGVTVRLKLLYLQGTGLASLSREAVVDISLQPFEFKQFPIGSTILGAGRIDFRDAQLLIEILSGDGAALAFTSSVDNGTADSLLRID